MNLDLLEQRIAGARGWWERRNRDNPNDAAAERRQAERIGYVAGCDDPSITVRCSTLAELVAVARAADRLLDALGSLEDLTLDELAALEVLAAALTGEAMA